jgi:hypothetical protein
MSTLARIIAVAILSGIALSSHAQNLANDRFAILYSQNMSHVTESRKPGFSLRFPRKGSANYISRYTPSRAVRGNPRNYRLTITGNIQASPNAVFTANLDGNNPGGAPPSVRPMMWEGNAGEFGRWWSRAGIELKPGRFVFQTRLRPHLWGSVLGRDGRANRQSWRNAFTQPRHVAMTFGGNHYGHGVRMEHGSATLRVRTFRFRK